MRLLRSHSIYKKCVDTYAAYVEGDVGIGPIPTGFGIEVTLNIHLEGMDASEAQKLVDAAHIVCPYSNATRNNINVTLNVLT